MSEQYVPESVFRNPIQIGLVVKDLDKTLENLQNILGMGPFNIVKFPPEGVEDVKMMYKGEQSDFTAHFCFLDLGNIEIEVIQPLTGKTIWHDFLEEKGPGLHHIKFMLPTHKPTEEFMAEKGIVINQMGASVGKNLGKEWVYYDTWDTCGFYIETMNSIVE